MEYKYKFKLVELIEISVLFLCPKKYRFMDVEISPTFMFKKVP